MSNHTPGPWHVAERVDDGDVLYTVEADNLPVADIYRKAEHETNARLIAAAPEMLALLDQAHSALQMAIASKKIGRFQDAVFADIGALLWRIEGETK